MPKRHRTQKHFRALGEQYDYNQNSLDTMRRIANKNMYKMIAENCPEKGEGWLFFVRGRVAVSPMHYLEKLDKMFIQDKVEDLKIRCIREGSHGNEFVVYYRDIEFMTTGDDSEDLVFWNFPKVVY